MCLGADDETSSPSVCAECKSCVILCSHYLERASGDNSRLQLHEHSGGLHIQVELMDGTDKLHTVLMQLPELTTEYIAEFYAAYVLSKEKDGFRATREGAAPVSTGAPRPLSLPDKKGDTNMETLRQYFHLPINEASKILGICSTSLKKICRKNGLPRWPHRKVKSIDQRLSKSASGPGVGP